MFKTLLFALPAAAVVARFRPDDRPLLAGGLNNLPLFYNLSTSLTKAQNSSGADSWWTTSFLHGDNDRDYYCCTHFLSASDSAITRASFLDLTSLAWSQIQNYSVNATVYNAVTGYADLQANGFSFVAIDDTDSTAGFHFQTSAPGVYMDLTFEGTSPALLNGALGALPVMGTETYEWAIPAGRTSGVLVINGTEVHVQPSGSITWFDREWGDGIPDHWHWFQMHLSSNDPSKLDTVSSTWVWEDSVNGDKQFGTFRDDAGQMRVVPVKSMKSSNNWVSPETNMTYALDYTLSYYDGSVFEISMVTADQEFRSAGNEIVPGYDGYATVKGKYQGREVTGFAVVEIVHESGIQST